MPPQSQKEKVPEVEVSESNDALSTGGLLEMLTRKQYELLRFINERLKEAGVPPSFDEMKDALDLRSKSGIHRLITALEERGAARESVPPPSLPPGDSFARIWLSASGGPSLSLRFGGL